MSVNSFADAIKAGPSVRKRLCNSVISRYRMAQNFMGWLIIICH